VITTNALITELPDKEEAMGDMGGMDPMGGMGM
jgi:hypothetical protein